MKMLGIPLLLKLKRNFTELCIDKINKTKKFIYNFKAFKKDSAYWEKFRKIHYQWATTCGLNY